MFPFTGPDAWITQIPSFASSELANYLLHTQMSKIFDHFMNSLILRHKFDQTIAQSAEAVEYTDCTSAEG